MWYFVAYAFRSAAFYVSLPIAGRLLAADEVGRFFYLLAIVNLASVAATLGMGSYVTRKSYSNRTVSYVFLSACTVAVVVHAVGILGGALFWSGVFAVGAFSCVRALSLLGETYLLASGNRATITALHWCHGVAFLVVGATAAIMFRRAESFLFATAVADVLIVVSAWFVVGRSQSLRGQLLQRIARIAVNLRVVRRGLIYGAPILLASLANLGLNSFDRFIVKHYLGYEDLAIFSVMYTLAFASSRFIGQPFNQVASQLYMRERAGPECQDRIRRQGVIATGAIAACTWATMIIGNDVLKLIGSAYVVDPVNFGLVGLSAMFALLFAMSSLHLKRSGNTGAFAARIVVAAAVNMALSVLLVPRLGIVGASISTYVAYSLLFLSCWKSSSDRVVNGGVVLSVLVVSALLLVSLQ